MAVSAVEDMLAPVRQIDGFVQACLIDGASGMILGSLTGDGEVNVAVAAAGVADVVNVLSLMTGELALEGGLEDVVVTLASHYHLIRVLPPGPAGQPVLLVTLNRPQTNLAMAHRELRDLIIGLV